MIQSPDGERMDGQRMDKPKEICPLNNFKVGGTVQSLYYILHYSMVWIKHGHVVAPELLYHGIL